jgi:tetratricopeptide (TPR) repeat protein
MFGFGKKKTKKPKQESIEPETAIITEEDKEEMLRTISMREQELIQADEEEKAKIYEDIGMTYLKIGEDDQAIDALEKSIQHKKTLGDGYKSLLSLYNKKRAEAARMNDDKSLQVYLEKMDQMMQVSKDVTRGVR